MKKIILLIFLLILLLGSAWVTDRRIRAAAESRASHFISVHYIAMEVMRDSLDPPPEGAVEMLNHYSPRSDSAILKPFPEGLIFKTTETGFLLEEPSPRFISLFRKDRLTATEYEWPHWDKSGTNVLKYEGQEIPLGYLREKP